ncbi:hypothetical protein N7493_010827 [Penicillium malachiteum]|uniref:Alkyl hydroperoxide reductase subunit C/ Thiol specific antioxidant domain-containing protein n=1 Tax=Penicillium malachiteum TaxID=1324776 RepID=A0AAD6MS19_9EURO|nr:hypothetical protein N7493_010827 [Penicillium malachiteum]
MGVSQELASWISLSPIEIAEPPIIGKLAPSCPKLFLPAENNKPTIVAFLRHCEFHVFMLTRVVYSYHEVAEASFLAMRKAAAQQPDINFISISHSDQQSTEKWLEAVGGSSEKGSSESVSVVVDADREVYARWGLGTVSWGHVLNPLGILAILKMGKETGIWNRPTESGSRWQGSGHWAVDAEGYVRWGGPATTAVDVIDITGALDALQISH